MPPEGRFGLLPDPAAAPRTVLGIACRQRHHPDPVDRPQPCWRREPRSRVVLLYGNRSADGIMFQSALEDLKDRYLGAARPWCMC